LNFLPRWRFWRSEQPKYCCLAAPPNDCFELWTSLNLQSSNFFRFSWKFCRIWFRTWSQMTSVWGDQSQVSFTPSLRSRRLISMQHLTGEVQVWSNVRHSSWSMTRADKELSPVVCKCLKHIWTCVENLLNWLSQLTHWVLAWWRSEQEQCGFNQRVILATVFPLVPHLPPIWLPLISEMYLSCPFCIRQHAHPAKSKLSTSAERSHF
jgi:hypothetical protein